LDWSFLAVLVGSRSGVKIADEVWIVTALLHREQPARLDFTVEEIIQRAGKEGIALRCPGAQGLRDA
jgi:hypothetical protein